MELKTLSGSCFIMCKSEPQRKPYANKLCITIFVYVLYVEVIMKRTYKALKGSL